MKKISRFFLILFFTGILHAQQTPNTLSKIETALQQGKISSEEALQLKYYFLHEHRKLPDAYQSETPVKCAFGIQQALMQDQKYHALMKSQKVMSAFIYVHSFISKGQTKRFHIHYDTTGLNAVPTKDANNNGIPDWIEETGLALEQAYRIEVDHLGYREPPNFSIYGFYNVFIRNLGYYYGSTTPDSQLTSNPWTYTSYIELDNDYAENFFTKGLDGMRVTCAHEFHHAVQLAYQNTYSDGDGWFYEVTSTWMEDVVYPEINDYLDYLRFYFQAPYLSLTHYNGQHEYAMAIWNHYAQKRYGRPLIRKVWEKMPQMNALNAWNTVLTEHTADILSTALIEFFKWNFFTSYRADTINYYPEGYLYPSLSWQNAAALTDSLSFSQTINLSSSRWYRFYLMSSTHAQIRFTANPAASHFYLLAFRKRSDQAPEIEYFPVTSYITIENLAPEDTLFLALINKTWQSTSAFSYQFSIKPTSEVRQDLNLMIYPNPVKANDPAAVLKISFRLTSRQDVFFEIFSLDGKSVYRSETMNLLPDVYSGSKALQWNLKTHDQKKIPAGVYIYRLKIGKKTLTGKIAVVR